MQNEQIIKKATECLEMEASSIMALIPRLNEDFIRAVQLIRECKGKIVVTGVGKSGHIGSKIAATLASTGTPAFFLNPLDAYHGDLGMLGPEDLVLAISYSGATEELLRFLPLIRAKHLPIIAMSSNPESLLAKNADVHLNIAVEREADPLNLVPTSSTTVTLALGDALACALIEAAHFQPSDFAMLHPGGDLGRKLLAKVEEVMVKEDLPLMTPATPMSEAIEVVTNGKLGVGIVLDKEQLVGIVTDGDIRRAMLRLGQSFFSTPVSDIMARHPKTISHSAKIVEAGETMNHYSIHSLVVLDNNNKVCGVIDSFSCLPGTRFYH